MRLSVVTTLFLVSSALAAPQWPWQTTAKKTTTTTTKTTTKSTTTSVKPITTTTTTTKSTTTTTKSTTTTTTTTTTLKTSTTTSSAKPTYTVPAGVDLSQIYINGITYGGSGCPQGSVGTYISNDRKTFTLIFDSYVASIGTGVPIVENRKNCQLNIDIQYPQGFQYSVFAMDYRGYAYLDQGVTATQTATYYFSGQSQQVSKASTFVGPKDESYLLRDEIISTSTVWSPCGEPGALNINSQLQLRSTVSGANGMMTTDSEDGKFTYVMGLQWARCP